MVPMAAFVPLTLVFAYHADVGWLLPYIFIWNYVMMFICIWPLILSDSANFYPIKKLFRVWFVFSVVVGTPASLVWTLWFWLESPRYIPLSVMSACILLFITILWLCRPTMGRRTTGFTLGMFTLYLIPLPVLIVIWGDIPAVVTWSQPLRITIACASAIGASVLMLIYTFLGLRYQKNVLNWWKEEHLIKLYRRHRPLVVSVLGTAQMAGFVPFTLVPAYYEVGWISWRNNLFGYLILVFIYIWPLIVLDSNFYPIKKLFRIWFVFSVVVAIPVSFVWMIHDRPRYIPLSVMSACILLFTTVVWLCKPTMGRRTTELTLTMFTLYLISSPVLILHGDIPVVEMWSKPLRIGISCASAVGAFVLMLIYNFLGLRYQKNVLDWWKEEHLITLYRRYLRRD